jgi:hypothetical protein
MLVCQTGGHGGLKFMSEPGPCHAQHSSGARSTASSQQALAHRLVRVVWPTEGAVGGDGMSVAGRRSVQFWCWVGVGSQIAE